MRARMLGSRLFNDSPCRSTRCQSQTKRTKNNRPKHEFPQHHNGIEFVCVRGFWQVEVAADDQGNLGSDRLSYWSDAGQTQAAGKCRSVRRGCNTSSHVSPSSRLSCPLTLAHIQADGRAPCSHARTDDSAHFNQFVVSCCDPTCNGNCDAGGGKCTGEGPATISEKCASRRNARCACQLVALSPATAEGRGAANHLHHLDHFQAQFPPAVIEVVGSTVGGGLLQGRLTRRGTFLPD